MLDSDLVSKRPSVEYLGRVKSNRVEDEEGQKELEQDNDSALCALHALLHWEIDLDGERLSRRQRFLERHSDFAKKNSAYLSFLWKGQGDRIQTAAVRRWAFSSLAY